MTILSSWHTICMLFFGLSLCVPSSALAEQSDEKTTDSSQLRRQTIYLAGGCFWGVEGYFQRIEGILDTEVGYANGQTPETSYQTLSKTGHAETVKIIFDSYRINLEEILMRFFRIIDPTSLNRQGNDRGVQYRTGIYTTNDKQLAQVRNWIKAQRKKYKDTIRVEVEPLLHFIPAEAYHQNYLSKNPTGYCHIDLGDATSLLIDETKYAAAKQNSIKNLNDTSKRVTQNNATERPFTSNLLEEEKRGLYVDIVTGEPLFLSRDKFDAGCGWPSFTQPVTTTALVAVKDNSHGMQRTEVRSRVGNSHLGHVFKDGPAHRGGLRYCINGAALRFIPYEKLNEQGYGDYALMLTDPAEHEKKTNKTNNSRNNKPKK